VRAYRWKEGFHIKANPQRVGLEVESLPDKSPAAVVAFAQRKRDAELRKCFEWDDRKAAHEHRLEQARYVLRGITVEVEIDGKPRHVRAFLSYVDAGKPAWTTMRDAMSNKEIRDQILETAYEELVLWRERYRQYEELVEVFKAIEKVKRKVKAG
jgi:hypothetical protein